jgi:uncharacterized Ntn-hydrolase superfamily protein
VTFSLAARCPRTGAFGMVISSSSPAVAARCVHLRAGVGAAASQNITDPRLGTRLLDQLQGGRAADGAIAAVVAGDPTADYRQLTVVDGAGQTAAHSGAHVLGVHQVAHGPGAVAAGNLLASPDVVDAMLDGYLHSGHQDLAARLLDGLTAALQAGGEAGPVHSAGLVALDPQAGWASTDLRIDWHDDPAGELRRLWELWLPQRADYITRGLDPASAPGFGVAGSGR